MRAYARDHGLEPDMADVFVVVLDKLDDCYLEDEQKRQNERNARDQRNSTRESRAATRRVK
jgi:hypothetical protein